MKGEQARSADEEGERWTRGLGENILRDGTEGMCARVCVCFCFERKI